MASAKHIVRRAKSARTQKTSGSKWGSRLKTAAKVAGLTAGTAALGYGAYRWLKQPRVNIHDPGGDFIHIEHAGNRLDRAIANARKSLNLR